MQIILSVLQFIGIAFLVLLGILLVLLLLILFYPICYTIQGELYSEKNAKAKVSWLFHLIRANVIYNDNSISAKIGIFWKRIPFSYEFKSKESSENWDETSKIHSEVKNTIESELNSENIENIESKLNLADANTDSTESEIADIISQDEDIISETQAEDMNEVFKDSSDTMIKSDETIKKETKLKEKKRKTKKKNKKEKQKRKKNSASNQPKKEKISFIEKIKGMISKIKGTLNKITQIWTEIKILITDECNQSAVAHIKKESISLLKSFLPKKSNVEGIFSLGSPDKTGKVFGILCAFPFIYQNKWSLSPDFTKEAVYFEGRFYAKGRIYLYKIVGMALSIIWNKNCRRFYKGIKQFVDKIKTYL